MNLVASFHERLSFSTNSCSALYESYSKFCRFIKENYMKTDSIEPIDRHKVAACISVSIIQVRPLSLTDAFAENPNIHLANEMLGVMCGFNVMESFIKEANKEGLTDQKDALAVANGFRFPKSTRNNKNTYFEDLCISLYHSSRTCSIDLLLLADVFYLIEESNKLAYTLSESGSE